MTTSTYRFTYRKGDALRYLGHLDTARLWQRTLRRAGLPLVFTQGFRPRLKLATGPPLSLGFTSRTELLEITLVDAPAPAQVRAQVEAVLTPGMRVVEVSRVLPHTPKMSTIETLSYTARPASAPLDGAVPAARATALLAAETLPVTRERKGRTRTFDVRSSLRHLRVLDDPLRIDMTLAVTPAGTANPREVLALFDLWDAAAIREAAIERTTLTFASPNTQGIHGHNTPDHTDDETHDETHHQAHDQAHHPNH